MSADGLTPSAGSSPDGQIEGRIIKGVGGLYTVVADDGTYNCNVRGVFRKRNFTPAVGDCVYVQLIDAEKRTGTITRFKPRRTELVRPRVANVDQAIIAFATHPAINVDMLDRFLLLAEERALEILICINKIDLTGGYEPMIRRYSAAGYRVLAVSAETGEGIDGLRRELDRRVSVFAGPSGVGKSSLVNILLSADRMETGELSHKIGRGKHTTRHAELIELYPGTYVVDTPGFTSLSLEHVAPEGLDRLFREFLPLGQCRFNDCRHISEPDCAVKARVGDTIAPERYERYVTIRNELENRHV